SFITEVSLSLFKATTYIFSVASVNDAVIATNQRTYSSQIGCTTTNNVTGCGTDSLFIPGVVLTVTGILALLITLGLLIAFRRNRLCCSSSEPSKQKKYQNVQLSERDNSEYYTTPSGEGESTQYQTLDGNEVAKASVYSEIGGTPRVAVYQNDPGNDRDGGNYESLHGRSNPNFYDELQTKPFGNKGTYKNVKPPQQYR
ncbi:uncharacterized protein, partial [Argopecten irradians]|uniref:uncharacterized protein n=1 Tax=Argopecten irradians TaxID=31199 RepID=UPI00370FBFBA